MNSFTKVVLDIIRTKNIKRALYNYKLSNSLRKTVHVAYLPNTLGIEVSMKCNLRCPTCFLRLKDPDIFEGGGFIPFDELKQFLDDYAVPIRRVGLDGGEPLMHPEIDRIVKYTKTKAQFVTIATNGILIKGNKTAIQDVDRVRVSVDAYDYATFKKYRGGTSRQFDSIIEGFEVLRDMNKAFNISFLLCEENVHEIKKMLQFCADWHPAEVLFHNINNLEDLQHTPLLVSSPRVENYVKEILSSCDYDFNIYIPRIHNVTDSGDDSFKNAICPQLWTSLELNWQGDMSICCYLPHSPEVGNVFQSLDFNSAKLKEMRMLHLKNEPPADCKFCQKRYGKEYEWIFFSTTRRWKSRTQKHPWGKR